MPGPPFSFGFDGGCERDLPAFSLVIPAEAGIHSRSARRIAIRRLPRGAGIGVVAWNGS
jgi:hypothetical protein